MTLRVRSPMAFLQPLGRALMLPIAVLPVAGLLLRLGQPDLLDIAFLGAAGNALFDNLGLLFAVGVATGFARDGNGAACLAGIVCYLVATKGAETFVAVPPVSVADAAAAAATLAAAARAAAIHKFDVPVGIVAGLVGGGFYNRYSALKLPDYLAFFGGRRFVPIASGIAGLALAAVLGVTYGPLAAGIDTLSQSVLGAGGWGLFAFGVLNRLLIVTGLHHILNNVAYFVVGDYHGATGDLRRFFAGDPTAGGFMSGFFPVMMFGLPAACLAMYHEALPARCKAAGGLLLSLALTAFLTGVTEPIEFSFMFVAPALYALHALLAGAAEAIMNAAGVKLGYGFSAGLFDYVLNFGRATRPLLLLPIGFGYALVYYAAFRLAIRRWDLPTPGREREEPAAGAAAVAGERGAAFVAALGGAANMRDVAACTTRLRLVVADQAKVDDAALKALGAIGVLRPSSEAVQVILGPIADAVSVEMRAAMNDAPTSEALVAAPATADRPPATLPASLIAVLGEHDIVAAERYQGRWRVALKRPFTADDALLTVTGVRSIGRPASQVLHILVDPD